MKKNMLCVIMIHVFICLLIIAGCATTARVTEPTAVGSTLLMGRIKATCTNFPKSWHINGDHTDGVMVKIESGVTNEIRIVRARGDDGLFFLTDPDIGPCRIVGFELQKHVVRGKIELGYYTGDLITVRGNAVNNVGDISWRCVYVTNVSTEFSRKGSYTKITVNESHEYRENYDDVRAWFEETYPASTWNSKNWVNAR